jgi:protein-S-isoprenylcysteine O-methyltransferase Ste14
MNNKLIAILKTTIKVIISIIVLLLLLFGSAGTIYWMEAWILLILYFINVIGFFIWLKKNNPELLKERTSRRSEGKWWDQIILTIYTILLMFMLVICGIDAVRFHWSNLPLILKIIGFIGYITSAIIISLTIKENAYLSAVVRIQKDRSQQVVKTGPYKYVRHPMYSGIILGILFIPFALGSFIALIFSGLIIILFIIRTYLEDKTLQNELPGYKEYIKEVRYRLVPGLW